MLCFTKNLPSSSPLQSHLSGVGMENNVSGNFLLSEKWHPKHSIPAFWVSNWRCLEGACLSEAAVPGVPDDGFPSSCIKLGSQDCGAHGRAPVAVFPCVLPSSHPLHHAFSKPMCSEPCRTSLAFLLLSPKSPHLPHLYPSKDSPFPQHKLLRKGTVR